MKTGLGIFSKEVLTLTVGLNVNCGFVKHLFTAGDEQQRGAVSPVPLRSRPFGAHGSTVASPCLCPCSS